MTGVQTCALPIYLPYLVDQRRLNSQFRLSIGDCRSSILTEAENQGREHVEQPKFTPPKPNDDGGGDGGGGGGCEDNDPYCGE